MVESTKAEVLAAVREILQARSHGGRATAAVSVPEYCAERMYPVVEILREATDAHDRVSRIDRLLGIARYDRQFASQLRKVECNHSRVTD